MLKFTKLLAASAALSLFATPVVAQDAEPPRTTYRVTMIDLADGADDRWAELHETVFAPARAAAGLAPVTVHWVMMNPDYDLMIVQEMPRGMSTFDTHANAERDGFFAEVERLLGGEAAMQAMGAEYGELVESETVLFTHTHP